MTRRKALLIGINYRGTQSELRGCITDVLQTKELLLKQRGFQESEITLITDDTPVKPTWSGIIDAFSDLIDDCAAGDQLYLHYSGHGSSTKDTDGDEADGQDEALVPLDYQTKGVITDDILQRILTTFMKDGASLLMVLDCCHSGSAMDLPYDCAVEATRLTGSAKEYKDEEWTAVMTIKHNGKKPVCKGAVTMLSGCADEQTSADAFEKGKYQGALTCCLLDTLAAHDVEWHRLMKDVHCRLMLGKYTQRPRLSTNLFPDFRGKF